MPEQNIFEGIGYFEINDYLSSAVNKQESNIFRMLSNLREVSRNAKTFEDVEKLAVDLNRFAMQLDPKDEKHRNFYDILEGTFINNLPQEFQGLTFYDACPTDNKINYILLSGFSVYLDKNKLAQEPSLNKISPQMQENLQAASYTTFDEVLPLIYNARCNESLRSKINNHLAHKTHRSSEKLLANLKAEFHDFETLKLLKGNILKEKVREILKKDTLFYKLTKYKGEIPDTLSGRLDIFSKDTRYKEALANELAFEDIRNGKAEQLGADKIAALLASDSHLGELTEKISIEKLRQAFDYAHKNNLTIAQNIRDKIFNKELAAAKKWDNILNMTSYKHVGVGAASSVKNYQTRFEIAAQKIAEIKNSKEYALMISDIQEYETMAADVKKMWDNRNNLSQGISYLEKIQALTENVLKNSNSQKDSGLSRKDLEKAAGSALNHKFEPLAHTNAKLPLIFGKKEEKKRQEALNHAIDELNKNLKELSGNKNSNPQIKDILSKYSGKLLEKTTLETLKNNYLEIQQEVKKKTDDLNSLNKNWNIDGKKTLLKSIAVSEETIKLNTAAVSKEKGRRLSVARNKLKEKTGIDTAGEKSGAVKADKIATEVIRAKESNGR